MTMCDAIKNELWGGFCPTVDLSDIDKEEDQFDEFCLRNLHRNFDLEKRIAKRRKTEKRNTAIVLAVTAVIATIGTKAPPTVRQ